jgi:hypothetical protein
MKPPPADCKYDDITLIFSLSSNCPEKYLSNQGDGIIVIIRDGIIGSVGVAVDVGVDVDGGTMISTQKTLAPIGPIPNRVPSGARSK